ncbi:DNA-binding HxlR family transcriptional regulator [Microbacterium ginsengiterrae]|uniref:DNA-binding HxlR family transcriptional regulator n=1 Tax=Microbacterium ginsengiterrae TaxID=546115 RepID=A0A7W9CC82_9MICO|nr:helix-turn-helix domain-containing protein [Microbacterium ginsengiterrae]MBB5742929.1 DNA-binding HxlR family transcriptional regulator [Microbacterium ginsengiterrae]
MAGTDTEVHMCDAAVTLAFSVLGKRWNGMIVATLGSGPAPFVALRRAVTGISDTVLSDRLAELGQAGLVARTVDAGPPITVTYSLTESGEGLVPILSRLGEWASANLQVPAH